MKNLLRAAALALLAAPCLGAQTDDFDDGNDDGWQRIAPISEFGIPATYSFPGGTTYKIESAANNVNADLGPPRVGSLRPEATYTDFYVFVDLLFDPNIDQNIGILTRVKEPGLGSLDGYGVTYNPFDGMMFLSVITDEEGNNIADVDVPTPPVGEGVRMVFQAQGANLKVELFALSDPANALATIEEVDATYSSGLCGVFSVSDPVDAAIAATFDNYFAAEAEPTRFGIVDVERDGNNLVIEYFSKPGTVYSLDAWNVEDGWAEVDDGLVGGLGETSTTSVPIVVGTTRMYRVRKL